MIAQEEDWIEYINKHKKEADEKMQTCNITNSIETQKKLKWPQAMRLATQRDERWTRRLAEWNTGLIISERT